MAGSPGNAGRNVTITGSGTGILTLTPSETINGISGLGILVDNTDAFTLNLNGLIALGANQEWRNTTLNSLNANAAATVISGAGNLTLRSTGANLSSSVRLDRNSASNYTFTGQLTVAEGNLRIVLVNNVSANGPLGNNTLPVILGETGDKLGFIRYGAVSGSTDKPFTLAAGGRGGFWVDHDTTTPTLTLSGKISGGGTLVKLGANDDGFATTLELTNSDND